MSAQRTSGWLKKEALIPVKDPPSKKPRTVEIVRSDYQPSKAELEEDVSIDTSFEELAQVVTEPVEIKYIPRPKKK